MESTADTHIHFAITQLSNSFPLQPKIGSLSIIIMIFVYFLILCSAARQLILKPHASSLETITMQIGQLRYLEYPLISTAVVNNIYSRAVVNAHPNDTSIARICKETPPTVNFTFEAQYVIDLQRKHPEIVTDFKDLLYRRGVIDAILFSNQLFTLFENGSVLVLSFNDNPLVFKGILTINNGANISEGQLLMVNGKILIIADARAYLLHPKNLTVVNLGNANLSSKFSMAIATSYIFFAVAHLDEGVGIYCIQSNKVVSKGVYGRAFFEKQEEMYVVDLAFDGKQTLYVLDQKGGLLMMDLGPILEGQGNPILINNEVKKANCENLVYTNGDIIMVCGDVFRYRAEGDQSIQQLPKPLFKVKEVTIGRDIVILIGDNLFNFYWSDRYIDVFQFTGASKIILYSNKFIAIQDSAIYSGEYKIKSPTLSCQADDLFEQQAIDVLFKTGGRCNPRYLDYLGETQVPRQGDTCLYTTPAVINFWKAENISLKPLTISFIVIGVLAVLAWIWMCMLWIKQRRFEGILNRFQGSKARKAGYNPMDDEKMVSSMGTSNISANQKHSEPPIVSTVSKQLNTRTDKSEEIDDQTAQEQFHEIGD